MKRKVDISYKSLIKHDEELCGDHIELLKTANSTIIILADGMGSGVKANILSTLTAKILGTMLYNGSSLDECVETIAKTLPICQVRQVAYSTFTILQTYESGETYIVEFENPGCIFIRDGKRLELPFYECKVAGKLVRECRIYAQTGDLFVLMSDGVTHAGVGRFYDFGWGWEGVSQFVEAHYCSNEASSRVVTDLTEHCKELYEQSPGDDTTVAALRIIDKKIVKIFTGPPVNPEDDEKTVQDFIEYPGIAVICGGTSANIVSRVMNRPLEVSLEYFDPDIPPMATMQGIDLVTEGIFTLNRVLELFKQYNEGHVDAAFFASLDRKDGGSRLAKLILENCTDLKLFVGRTINAAYQNPMIPFDFNLRVALIEQLKDAFEQAGKTVDITYV